MPGDSNSGNKAIKITPSSHQKREGKIVRGGEEKGMTLDVAKEGFSGKGKASSP